MNPQIIVLTALTGAVLSWLSGYIYSRLRDILAGMTSVILVLMISLSHGYSCSFSIGTFMGFPLVMQMNSLSWIFALTISAVTLCAVIFSYSYMHGKENNGLYYFMLLLVNTAMLGIVFSGDFLTLFIFWEIMSWATFLLISLKKGKALEAGMKYIIMSVFGSMAMLGGILYIYSLHHTLVFSKLSAFAGTYQPGSTAAILILFFIGFGIKHAVIPFHSWLPPAHSEAVSPFSSILSGILIKMGTYGFVVIIYIVIGLKTFLLFAGFRYILHVLAAMTIIVPTFIALRQDDAKRLLAWSTVAQAGYIMAGIVFSTGLSVLGGLFHFVNHAAFKALLFLAVGAVEYRTNGVRDLNRLGGLIKRMPLTFSAVLIGVCGLIGVPLFNGFVSKWMLYKSLIMGGSPLLAFAALIGTWGTVLYSYKLIHNMFLGQLPREYKDVEKAPLSMRIPMVLLALPVVLFGIMPGIVLRWLNSVIVSLGFKSIKITLWGIASSTGSVHMIYIAAAVLGGVIVALLLLSLGKKPIRIAQEDTYAAGAAIPEDKYNFTVDFYSPISKTIAPFCKDIIDTFYTKTAAGIVKVCSMIRKVYTGYVGTYVMYIIFFLAALVIVQLAWSF